MFRLSVFYIFLFFSTISYAQKCHYEIEKLDLGTGLYVKRTEPIDIARVNDHSFLIKAQCIGSKKYMKIRYYRNNGFVIRSSEPLEFFFIDNTSVKVLAREMSIYQSNKGLNQISSMLVYDLSTEQYLQLLNKPVRGIKYYVEGGGFVRLEIKKKYQGDIQYIMNCILLDTDKF